jgi:uncharacterized protein YjbI with pentapeptide repeats
MAEATDKKAALLAKWRKRWREMDFTWEGLTAHELQGWVVADGLLREAENGRVYGQPILETPQPTRGVEATLQDYWRADPATGQLRDDAAMDGELIVVPNQPTYHVTHLPLEYDDGAATGKADLAEDAVDALMGARLAKAGETHWQGEINNRNIIGPDRDAQFTGCVLAKAPTHPDGKDQPLSLRLNLALMFHCDFAQAKFSGDARFGEAAFGGDARFDGVTFSGNTDFGEAKFCGVMAQFGKAAFRGKARFVMATFSGIADFVGATFSGEAQFDVVTFNGPVWMLATFSDNAEFTAATFNDHTTFNGATFNGYRTGLRARFRGETEFSGATFSGIADFVGATFSGMARFVGATFSGVAEFDRSKFQSDMDFTSATFERIASFQNIAWPQTAADYHSAFGLVMFRSTLSLTGSGLRSFAAFDGARLDGGLHIDDPDERTAGGTFNAERKAAIAASRTDGEVFEREENAKREEAFESEEGEPSESEENNKRTRRGKFVQVSRAEIRNHVRSQREARLRELERGCRVLKLAFERAANKSREQMLYRFELRARRAQRDLPPGEALFSDLYALASDYGASMVRPFVALAVLIVFFAAIYLGWAYALGIADLRDLGQAAQAIEFSLTNTFRPLSALSAEGIREGAVGARLLEHDDFTALGVRAISIVQSLLAIVLAFLFALAVRRRFQIS